MKHERDFVFQCESCGAETPVKAIVDVTVEEDTEHVFDHIMTCGTHLEEAVDYIFTRFTELGVAIRPSGITQMLRYLDEYCTILDERLLEEEEDD